MSGRTVGGFYLDPPIWLEEKPQGQHSGELAFDDFNREVARGILSCGIEYRASIEGLISFEFSSWEPGRISAPVADGAPDFDQWANSCLQRTFVMNAFLTFFYSRMISDHQACLDRMVVTPECEIASVNLDMTGTTSFRSNRVSHLASSRYPATYNLLYPPLADSRINMRRGPFSKRIVDLAAADLSNAIERGGVEDLALLDLFLRGSKAYQDHNHSVCVISYWAIIEKLVSSLWSSYLDANANREDRQFIDGDRRRMLKDSRTFTASVVIETLSFNNVISLELYQKLGAARKARNKWMHNLSTVDRNQAEAARSACEELLQIAKGYAISGQSNLVAHD